MLVREVLNRPLATTDAAQIASLTGLANSSAHQLHLSANAIAALWQTPANGLT